MPILQISKIDKTAKHQTSHTSNATYAEPAADSSAIQQAHPSPDGATAKRCTRDSIPILQAGDEPASHS
ncbi:MAG: hypothetical protein DRJ32_03605 [Thermoprotei archaeon]|nr:MAG: hypothetical protein DRJ32_03605 [Thermoprotei archaeon]